MITREEILKGAVPPENLASNLDRLLEALNKFREVYGKEMIVTSGYRSPEHNAAVGGRPGSAHLTCEACDFADPERTLAHFCLANRQLLEACGLWMESPDHTPNWVHLQTRPAHNRVFIP
jgi:uncharacterized protein YcbK (DUF882 family)